MAPGHQNNRFPRAVGYESPYPLLAGRNKLQATIKTPQFRVRPFVAPVLVGPALWFCLPNLGLLKGGATRHVLQFENCYLDPLSPGTKLVPKRGIVRNESF